VATAAPALFINNILIYWTLENGRAGMAQPLLLQVTSLIPTPQFTSDYALVLSNAMAVLLLLTKLAMELC